MTETLRSIWTELFSECRDGVFVDVGAAGPEYLSNSAFFRSVGWKIIAVEPNPFFCDLHRQKGFEILQYACGPRDEDNVDFQMVDSKEADHLGGKVTFEACSALQIKPHHAASAQNVKTIKVHMRRLDTLLREHAPQVERVDILSIDVEGWELEVLEGLDLNRYRPKVMVIENLVPENGYVSHVESLGYALWKSVPFNDVFLCQEGR